MNDGATRRTCPDAMPRNGELHVRQSHKCMVVNRPLKMANSAETLGATTMKPQDSTIRELRYGKVRARKTHRCVICDAPIERGELHCVQVYRNDELNAPPRNRVRQVRYHVKCPQMELAL